MRWKTLKLSSCHPPDCDNEFVVFIQIVFPRGDCFQLSPASPSQGFIPGVREHGCIFQFLQNYQYKYPVFWISTHKSEQWVKSICCIKCMFERDAYLTIQYIHDLVLRPECSVSVGWGEGRVGGGGGQNVGNILDPAGTESGRRREGRGDLATTF